MKYNCSLVLFPQISLELSNESTVVETRLGLFTRLNLTLNDPPLMSINCTSNCEDRILLSHGVMHINVSPNKSIME